MATNNWLDGSDNWTVAGDWSDGLPTPDDNVVIAAGNPQVTSNVGTVASVTDSAQLTIRLGGSLTVTGSFTNSGQLLVDPFFGDGGSSLTIGGTLTNTNLVQLGNTGLTGPETVTVGAVSNTGGVLNVLGSTTSSLNQMTLDVNSVAGFGAAGVVNGQVNLTGSAVVQFDSGQITTINSAAQIYLEGNARIADAGSATTNSALVGLISNAGVFELRKGASVTTSGSLTNSGNLFVDRFFGDGGGTSLTIGGTLTNTNLVQLGNTGLTTSETVTVGGISNTGGILNVIGNTTGGSLNQMTLDVNSAAGFGAAGTVNGQVNLTGNAVVQFDSGQITTINSAAQVYLEGNARIADVGSAATNSALVGLTSNAGVFELRKGASVTTSGSLNNSGSLFVDRFFGDGGGTSLTIGGTLTNTSLVQIGNTGLTTSETVAVGALSNTGGIINLIGNTTGGSPNQMKLDVNSVAGFGAAGVVNGQVNLQGNALIEFNSGQITTINSAAQIYLEGNARIADAGNTATNSALVGLASNAGVFEVRKGASVTTSGSLSNSGSLFVDRFFGDGGGTVLTIGGTVTNTNLIQLGNTGLSSAETVTFGGISNSGGTLNVIGNTTGGSLNQMTLDVNAVAGFGSAGVLNGQVNLQGNALIEFNSGQITTISSGAQLSLDGANARIADTGSLATNSALVGLTSNAGNVFLRHGASVTTSGALSNTGQILIDTFFGDGGASLTIGGTLTNSNVLQIGNGGLAADSTLTAGGLNNTTTIDLNGNGGNEAILHVTGATTGTGTINLSSGSVVEFGGSVAATQTVHFNEAGSTVVLDAPESFSGAITNFIAGDTIDLSDEIVTHLSYSGSTLTMTEVGGTDAINVTGTFTGLAATTDGGTGSVINVITSPYALTAGRDAVLFLSGSNTVTGVAATLNATDDLAGAGSDTLALTGGGSFNLATLHGFTGFNLVTLDNTGSTLTLRAGTPITVTAGTGADTFVAGTGALTPAYQINGGAGADTLSLNGNFSAGLTFGATTITNIEQITVAVGNDYSLTTNDATVGAGLTLTVTATGLGANDTLTFNGAAETNGHFNVSGGNGADSLTGGALSDTLSGGNGNDLLKGGLGADTLNGGGDIDTADYRDKTAAVVVTLNGGNFATVTVGGVSEDTIKNIENIYGGSANDTLTGDANANFLYGFTGDDLLKGGGGADQLDGYTGVDTVDYGDQTAAVAVVLNGSTFATVTIGGLAEDSIRNIENLIGGSGDDSLTGDGTANTLIGNVGVDTLSGGSGDDLLQGGIGNDTLNGGNNVDTADYRDKTTSVVVALNGGINATVTVGGVAEDTIKNIENVYGGSGADTLTGDANANFLYGFTGDDLLKGGGGADQIDGYSGVDTVDYGDQTAAVVVTLNGSTFATVTIGGVAEDSIRNIEKVIGGSGDDTLTGDGAANTLIGNAGIDTLSGGNGDDLLQGGLGNDTLNGGGNVDTADYREKTSAVVVTLNGGTNTTVTVGGVAEDTIKNIENIYGGSGADRLTGDSNANFLYGYTGNDVLKGGLGADQLDGYSGNDTADYRDKTTSVAVTLNGSTFVTVTVGGAAEDSIRNIENVYGGTAADTLAGDAQANVFAGGLGNDTLTGAGASDIFLFNTTLNAATNLDHLTDFTTLDEIDLDDAIFTTLSTGTLAAGAFASGAGLTSAQDADDRIVYNTTNGALFYDSDGVGGTASIQFAVVDTHAALTNADFVVV